MSIEVKAVFGTRGRRWEDYGCCAANLTCVSACLNAVVVRDLRRGGSKVAG